MAFRFVKNYLIGKYQSFHNSDNCFVVMMFCNHLIGFFDNPGSSSICLRLFKRILIACTIIYELLEMLSAVFILQCCNIDQHFVTVFLVFCRLNCVTVWYSLAVYRHDLKQIWINLLDVQRLSTDDRRRKYIRAINWFSLIFLMQNLLPLIVWVINGQTGSPMVVYENKLLDMLNTIVYPIAVFLLTLMFCYSMIVVCSILASLSLEFRLLGSDFERMFEGIRSLEETVRKSMQNWDQLEVAFKRCIERHQCLLTTAVAFSMQLKTYFLIQLLINFFLIVLSSFIYLLTQRNESSKFVFSAFAAIANLVNLMLYGVLCDQLEEEVTAINYRLYCSDWTDKLIYSRPFGRRYRKLSKMMVIVMERTQKKIGFSCGNLFAMSLVTCRKVLWFAYSVLTVLMSFLE